jgi:hypothetical protein
LPLFGANELLAVRKPTTLTLLGKPCYDFWVRFGRRERGRAEAIKRQVKRSALLRG